MTQPDPGQAAHARKLIVQLGQLLTDITSGRPAARVHQQLLDQFDAAVHDYRIDAMQLGAQEFAATWHALQYGLDLPADAWEKIVLPTVVGFSGIQKLKIHLELATSYWLAARAAVDAVPDYPAAAAALPDPSTTDDSLPAVPSQTTPVQPGTPRHAFAAEPATAPTAYAVADRPERPGPDRRVLVAIAVAVLATVTVMLVFVIRPTGDDTASATPQALPSPLLSAGVMDDDAGQPVTLPTAPPSASPQPSPMITTEPTPAPSWTPPTPATTKPGTPAPPKPVAPSAPRHLIAVAADEHRVWLSWAAPVNGGSGGVAYYRVIRDGQVVGWTRDTSVTVTGLAPGKAYRFTVIAVNAAGLQSAPSNQITTMTASPSPSAPPPSPSTVPPSPSEPPSPSPSETTAEPTPSPADPSPSSTLEASSPAPEPPVEPEGGD